MNQDEMHTLIRDGVPTPGGTWADLGAGTGNFTWALSTLLGSQGVIYAIDRDARAIAAIHARTRSDPPAAAIEPRQADLTQPLALPPLDGVLIANVLHFMRDQPALLDRIAHLLRPGGRLLVVEYELDRPQRWVPFPVPFDRLTALIDTSTYAAPVRIGTRRSPSSGVVLYAAITTVSKH